MAARRIARALARHRGWLGLLALLWLAAQQAALWHPLQHLPAGAAGLYADDAAHDHDAAADAGCSLCLALASLGAATAVADAAAVARVPATAPCLAWSVPEARPALPAQHNRGPPAAR